MADVNYMVEAHQGVILDTWLQNHLNGKASEGWRLVSTIASYAAPDEGPFQVLLIFER